MAAEGEEMVVPHAASANEMRSGGRTSRVLLLGDESIAKAPDKHAVTSSAAAIIGVNVRFMTVSSPGSEWAAKRRSCTSLGRERRNNGTH